MCSFKTGRKLHHYFLVSMKTVAQLINRLSEAMRLSTATMRALGRALTKEIQPLMRYPRLEEDDGITNPTRGIFRNISRIPV